MRSSARDLLRVTTSFLLILTLVITTTSWAQTHVVSPADLQKAAAEASDTRAKDQATLRDFFSLPQAEQALAAVHIDPAQVRKAVSKLNDHELRELAARASEAQANFAAGRISDRDLLWILIAVAALIVIIVAVR